MLAARRCRFANRRHPERSKKMLVILSDPERSDPAFYKYLSS
jgi:hypothetical protein